MTVRSEVIRGYVPAGVSARPRIQALILAVSLPLSLLGALVTPVASATSRSSAGSSPYAAELTSLPGPPFLDTGFSDVFTFQESLPAQSTEWFTRAQGLGSSFVRLAVVWSVVQPARPAPGSRPEDPQNPSYRWSSLDVAVEQAVAHGQRPVLMLVFAPTWALGRGAPASAPAGTWRPSPRALGQFAHALAERYSGRFPDPLNRAQHLPAVHYFQAWNEPNLKIYLSPQWARNRRGQPVPASPVFYRRMLNAVYAGVKAAQPKAFVLTAGTAPYGDPAGVGRMAPVVFDRALLCLSGAKLRPAPCPDPAHFDALDHHPYSRAPTDHAVSLDDVGVPDLGRLRVILHIAERTGRALPAGPKPIWVTEIAKSSNPPQLRAISVAQQARYLMLTLYELWREGVTHVFWLLIRDFPYQSLTGSGVYFFDGTPKPSAQAFAFPFVALPARGRMLTLWGRAPRPGIVAIERAASEGWTPVLRVYTTYAGIFYARIRLRSTLALRAQMGSAFSLAWTNRTPPKVPIRR